jgi:apolipoprotein N-acyltransferase
LSILADQDAAAPAATPLHIVQEFMMRAQGRGAFLRAAGAGAFCQLAHAPLFIWPAFVVGMTLFVWSLDGARNCPNKLRAFAWRGWSFGFGYFLAGLFWVGGAFLVEPEKFAIFLPFAISALPAGLGLFWAAAALAAGSVWVNDSRRAPLIAGALCVAEYMRGHIFGGFPWGLAGTIWEAGGAVSQAASYVGIYGLTAITLLIGAAPAVLVDSDGVSRKRFVWPAAGALCIGLLWGAGAQRIATAPAGDAGVSIRVADSGVSQLDKWKPENAARVLNAYLDATGGDFPRAPRIVIWPEGALPFLLLETPAALDAVSGVVGSRTLIVGSVRAERIGSEENYYNSALIFQGNAGSLKLQSIYDKRALVPFGEFMPPGVRELTELFGVSSLQAIGKGFTPGPRPTVMQIPGAPDAAILICYESIFPRVIPRGADRPKWIISVTNDSWFGATSGPWQHYNQGRYRAIEEGIPLARAASGGVSAVVDALGRPASAELYGGEGFADAKLPNPLPPTLYSQYGDLGFLGMTLLLLSTRLFSIRSGREK